MSVEVVETTGSTKRAIPLVEPDDDPRSRFPGVEPQFRDQGNGGQDRRSMRLQTNSSETPHRRLSRSDPRNHKQTEKPVGAMVRRGLSAHIDIDDDRSAFILYRRQWQRPYSTNIIKTARTSRSPTVDIARSWSERSAKPRLRKVRIRTLETAERMLRCLVVCVAGGDDLLVNRNEHNGLTNSRRDSSGTCYRREGFLVFTAFPRTLDRRCYFLAVPTSRRWRKPAPALRADGYQVQRARRL